MTRSYISERIPDPNASSAKRFLQFSLFSPLVLPLIPLVGSPMVLDLQVGSVTAFIGFLLIFSLLLGGVPYVLFLIGAFVWMRDKDAEQVRQMIYLSPAFFSGVLFACSTIFGGVGAVFKGEPGTLVAGAGMGIFLSIFALVIGYAYVGMINLAFVVYRRANQGRML